MASVGLFAPMGWSKNARMSAMRRLRVRPSVTMYFVKSVFRV